TVVDGLGHRQINGKQPGIDGRIKVSAGQRVSRGLTGGRVGVAVGGIATDVGGGELVISAAGEELHDVTCRSQSGEFIVAVLRSGQVRIVAGGGRGQHGGAGGVEQFDG